MSRGVNKAIIIGTLGKDPEIRYTPSGTAVATLSVATNEAWKDKQTGENQERTEWHRVVLWGKVAEIANQYLKKGSQAYFEGQLRTNKWQDRSGNDRYTTEIVARDMQMLSSPDRKAGSHSSAQSQPAQGQVPQTDAFGNDGFDDIPF